MSCPFNHSAELNPAVLPLDWLLGSWCSDEPGEGSFPSIAPFYYTESLQFSHVGQPVINFMLQPGTNRVAFIIAQNSGLVEIEEGELTGQQLTLHSTSLARTSFARQISRHIQLRADGRLEQTVCMALEGQPLSQHLHITYRRAE
ncbi:hypothetical protein DNTS_018966 [Danionella cerebrum]|uniref:THAP4-like heme-binding domain-containing protein n=1 Tax=Danionella cerebrum TaxID=2873325 RepID=A0A553QP10_9TELE|nr:hypothetical protein DNTS_018966 [Danionella translucida]